ncbi:hypothetical protein P152DRAFT_473031 [Eremomyces bilateralis CBS 781.70]|uniref:Uncharacterized protein n=1 Tax=Eremomyces bilateralis CBS 781.70 TaxID=1392243 RepID=A0A6G1G5C9_9PEZI|nr:uncharacterized protein P152DRAFT_473031 [Eremomyces bilateralis CBS 781.70]KAF1813295.1 hypothetical protein P152DRAFT_473031 [Eremomyces bilateralis CBS 781.70]
MDFRFMSVVTFPFVKLGQLLLGLVLTLLRLAWSIIYTIILPGIYVGQFAYRTVLYPFVLLGKLEDLYIFFSFAVLIGALAATTAFSLYRGAVLVLDLNPETAVAIETPAQRSISEYREGRKQRRKSKSPWVDEFERSRLPPSPLSPLSPGRFEFPVGGTLDRKRDLMSQTILEEEDSSGF